MCSALSWVLKSTSGNRSLARRAGPLNDVRQMCDGVVRVYQQHIAGVRAGTAPPEDVRSERQPIHRECQATQSDEREDEEPAPIGVLQGKYDERHETQAQQRCCRRGERHARQ